MAKNVKKQRTAAFEKTAYCVYIGPSLRGLLQSGQIFQGSVEQAKESAADAIAKYPAVAHLIVSGETLSDARIKVITPGTALYRYRRDIESAAGHRF